MLLKSNIRLDFHVKSFKWYPLQKASQPLDNQNTAGSRIDQFGKQKWEGLTPEKAIDATTKQTDDVNHFVMMTRMTMLLLNIIFC